MWNARLESLESGRTLKYHFDAGDVLTFREAIEGWQNDAAFRDFFVDTIRNAPFNAFRWETPPVTRAKLDRAFEFVLIDSPQLARRADAGAFAEHFQVARGEMAVAAENLGRDAMLVIPCPHKVDEAGAADTFAHLASFVRHAAPEQVDAFWQLVGRTMHEHVGERLIWLSTAGMGVAWLHVRLDQRPKYYAHGPYRDDRCV